MDFGFEGGWRPPTPSKFLLSQICTMSTFYMARALLMETMFITHLDAKI
jgi:hypothetical protein